MAADPSNPILKGTLAALLHRVTFLRWTGVFRRAYNAYRRDAFTLLMDPHQP